jgi:tetratricopeptide (TPR) repeat protein
MTDAAAASSTAAWEAAPPFPGLRPFSFRDHRYFFGREDQTFALCLLVLRHHFVAVVGSSGSGKSSIVRAGLLPKLDEENSRSPTKPWQWLTVRPGIDPMGRLADALAEFPLRHRDNHFEARRGRIAAILSSSSQGISEAIAHSPLDKNAQLVLVVDQFEELFRYVSAGPQVDRIEMTRRHDKATDFVQLLLAATRSLDSRIRVVITMRSDFIGDCALFQGLPEAVSQAQFLVPSLSKDQCREAIYGPIKLSGATIDSELVERMVNDASAEPDRLPVLQHCLSRLWMRASVPATADDAADPAQQSGRRLSLSDYKQIGGLSGALSAHANEIVDSLPGKEDAVEQIFRALTEIDKDGRAIRRARALSQLIAETGAPQEDICAVLDRFRAEECSFVVPPLSAGATSTLAGDAVIDVGHEALLRRWNRVCGDPEATGQRADKRDTGWLKKEHRDGESYEFLRSCVDPESPNDSRLPANQVDRYWDWWNRRKPNPVWAARYGGWFDEVKRLVEDSYAERRLSRQWRGLAYAAAALVPIVLVAVFLHVRDQQKQIEQTNKLAVQSAEKFSKRILEMFNAGHLTTSGAEGLQNVAADMAAVTFKDTSETGALQTNWLLTSSDVDLALRRKQLARKKVEEAESIARKYLAQDPGNHRWNELLYGSLFRLGDLDLDEAIDRADTSGKADPVLAAKALAAYQESQRIAETLLTFDVRHPSSGTFEAADINYLAGRRFYLAFSINKVGEAMQVQENLSGALENFSHALEVARTIENAKNVDAQLQSATTKTKIASIFMQRKPPDLDGALRNYSEAIAREELVLGNDPANNIVRSNLAAAYEGRAAAFRRSQQFEAAFGSYAQAIRMVALLVDNDARDTKWLERMARAHHRFGTALEDYALSQNQSLDKAKAQFEAEVATRAKLLEKDPTDAGLQAALRTSQQKLASLTAEAETSK